MDPLSDPGNTMEVDMDDFDDVCRWAQRLGISPQQLSIEAEVVGPRIVDIQHKLGLAISGVRPS